jgi:hypothetical protein
MVFQFDNMTRSNFATIKCQTWYFKFRWWRLEFRYTVSKSEAFASEVTEREVVIGSLFITWHLVSDWCWVRIEDGVTVDLDIYFIFGVGSRIESVVGSRIDVIIVEERDGFFGSAPRHAGK